MKIGFKKQEHICFFLLILLLIACLLLYVGNEINAGLLQKSQGSSISKENYFRKYQNMKQRYWNCESCNSSLLKGA